MTLAKAATAAARPVATAADCSTMNQWSCNFDVTPFLEGMIRSTRRMYEIARITHPEARVYGRASGRTGVAFSANCRMSSLVSVVISPSPAFYEARPSRDESPPSMRRQSSCWRLRHPSMTFLPASASGWHRVALAAKSRWPLLVRANRRSYPQLYSLNYREMLRTCFQYGFRGPCFGR